jgi:membrane protein DedA with SNARE-associated domain
MIDGENSHRRRENAKLLRRLLTAASAAGLLTLIALAATSELQMEPSGGWPDLREATTRFGYLGGFLLIYVEESGIPLFIPGDVFLVYVEHRLPADPWAWLAAWAGFVVAVVLGAMNLYLLSRRLGRRVLAHPFARFLHLTPERLAKAESEFRRGGPWAVIAGRHLPGLRVPITVAAGVLGMNLRIFLASVAISSGVWAAVFLALGIAYGESVARLLHMPITYVIVPVALAGVSGLIFRRQLVRLIRGAPALAKCFWRPQRSGAPRRTLAVPLLCSAALLAVFAAEYLTETAYVAIAAAIPVVTAAWLLTARTAAAVMAFGGLLTVLLHFLGSLDALSSAVEVAVLTVVGSLIMLAASLSRARNEGRGLKGDLEEYDRRLQFLENTTLELINSFAHELRTPLGVARGYVSLLEDGDIESSQHRAVASIISKKLDEISDLTERSLAEYAQKTVAAAREPSLSPDVRSADLEPSR